MTTGRTIETKAIESKIENETTSQKKVRAEREYLTLIADLDSLKKIFEKLQIDNSNSSGFDILKTNFEKIIGSPIHFHIKKEWTDRLNKMRDSEKREYNLYEYNLHWIIQDGKKNLDELVNGLVHINAEAAKGGLMADTSFRYFEMASIYVDVCVMASRIIEETNRFITKIEKHIFKPGSSLSKGQKLLMASYAGMVYLRSFTPLQDWRPPVSEKEEINRLKTYLMYLAEQLEKIKHSAITNLDIVKKERAEYKKKMQEEFRMSFSTEKKQSEPVALPSEEKKPEIT